MLSMVPVVEQVKEDPRRVFSIESYEEAVLVYPKVAPPPKSKYADMLWAIVGAEGEVKRCPLIVLIVE
jgi:hypothetical protein